MMKKLIGNMLIDFQKFFYGKIPDRKRKFSRC